MLIPCIAPEAWCWECWRLWPAQTGCLCGADWQLNARELLLYKLRYCALQGTRVGGMLTEEQSHAPLSRLVFQQAQHPVHTRPHPVKAVLYSWVERGCLIPQPRWLHLLLLLPLPLQESLLVPFLSWLCPPSEKNLTRSQVTNPLLVVPFLFLTLLSPSWSPCPPGKSTD